MKRFAVVVVCAASVFGQALPSQQGSASVDPKVYNVDPKLPPKKKDPIHRPLQGLVKDPAGNTIGGALIQLTDLKAGKTYSIVARPDGSYRFDDLDRRKDYELKASFQGATSELKKLSTFDPRDKPIINFELPLPADAKPAADAKKDSASQ